MYLTVAIAEKVERYGRTKTKLDPAPAEKTFMLMVGYPLLTKYDINSAVPQSSALESILFYMRDLRLKLLHSVLRLPPYPIVNYISRKWGDIICEKGSYERMQLHDERIINNALGKSRSSNGNKVKQYHLMLFFIDCPQENNYFFSWKPHAVCEKRWFTVCRGKYFA